jgi:hypothetical protein
VRPLFLRVVPVGQVQKNVTIKKTFGDKPYSIVHDTRYEYPQMPGMELNAITSSKYHPQMGKVTFRKPFSEKDQYDVLRLLAAEGLQVVPNNNFLLFRSVQGSVDKAFCQQLIAHIGEKVKPDIILAVIPLVGGWTQRADGRPPFVPLYVKAARDGQLSLFLADDIKNTKYYKDHQMREGKHRLPLYLQFYAHLPVAEELHCRLVTDSGRSYWWYPPVGKAKDDAALEALKLRRLQAATLAAQSVPHQQQRQLQQLQQLPQQQQLAEPQQSSQQQQQQQQPPQQLPLQSTPLSQSAVVPTATEASVSPELIARAALEDSRRQQQQQCRQAQQQQKWQERQERPSFLANPSTGEEYEALQLHIGTFFQNVNIDTITSYEDYKLMFESMIGVSKYTMQLKPALVSQIECFCTSYIHDVYTHEKQATPEWARSALWGFRERLLDVGVQPGGDRYVRKRGYV